MDARAYLEQVFTLKAQADLKWRQVQVLRSSLTIGSAPLDTEHVAHTHDTDVMGRTVAAIADM